MSQLDLALSAEVSSRHLSFIETGRSVPSRKMLLHLARRLDLSLREQNRLLQAAGYAPAYSALPLDAPGMDPVRTAVRQLLAGHEPYPFHLPAPPPLLLPAGATRDSISVPIVRGHAGATIMQRNQRKRGIRTSAVKWGMHGEGKIVLLGVRFPSAIASRRRGPAG